MCLFLETHSNDTGPVLAHKAHLVIVVKNPFSIFLHLFLLDQIRLLGDPIKNEPAQEAYLKIDTTKECKVVAVLLADEAS